MTITVDSDLKHIINKLMIDIILEIADMPDKEFIYIKNNALQYVYLNAAYCKICGFSNATSIIGCKNEDVFRNKLGLEENRLLEEMAVNNKEKKLATSIIIYPNHGGSPVFLQGKLYSFEVANEKDNWLLAIYNYTHKRIKIRFNNLFSISLRDLAASLSQRSYIIRCNDCNIKISRREILCLWGTLQCKQAGEIAEILKVKQVSIESYLNNLKNNLGVSTKNEIIESVIKNGILEQLDQII